MLHGTRTLLKFPNILNPSIEPGCIWTTSMERIINQSPDPEVAMQEFKDSQVSVLWETGMVLLQMTGSP